MSENTLKSGIKDLLKLWVKYGLKYVIGGHYVVPSESDLSYVAKCIIEEIELEERINEYITISTWIER